MNRMIRNHLSIFAMLLVLTASQPAGGTSEVAVTASSRRFAANFVAAINTKDAALMRRLTHPKCLPCMNGEGAEFFRESEARDFTYTVPANYKIKIEPIAPDARLLLDDAFTYPVRPTHYVEIDYETAPYKSVSLVRQVVMSGGKWLLIRPCPTADTLRKHREMKAATHGSR